MKTILDFFQLFGLILSAYMGAYFILSGAAYWIFYIAKRESMQHRKIQMKYPPKKVIYQEMKWSVMSMLILSCASTVVIASIINGYTRVYYAIPEFGWFYFFGSIIFSIILNDSYFYWVHRFMHLKAVFPKVHMIHHRSKTPTPWSVFSFSPVEALILYGIFPILVFFIPLHPVSLSIIVFYNVISNLSGHLGFEIVPLKYHRHWLLKYSLTVTHHELHHAKVKCNYGLYFNFWDRLMKTNHADNEKRFMQIQEQIHKASSAAVSEPGKTGARKVFGKMEILQGREWKN